MSKNFKSSLLLVLFILSSCGVTKESVSGIYFFKDKNNPEFSEAIHLYPDGTFNYQFSNAFVPFPRLKGTWRLTDDTVILNSSNFAVQDDTIRLVNAIYQARHNSLRRHFRSAGRYRTLKKINTKGKPFVLDFDKF